MDTIERNNSIISLKKIRDHHLPLVGSKASSLTRLTNIGLMVPPGFCVTTTAFRKHLEANELTDKVRLTLEKMDSTPSEERKAFLLEIWQAIIESPLAVNIRDEIEHHFHSLGANRVAVRSSATAEDLPDHSFAGQYESYLGITDLSGCIDSVKKCWASLWTERAYDYRQNNGFDHQAVNMAVIVQSLIEADASGVIFTADPVNGYRSRMIIEAVSGMGDSLVSGKVMPDRFIIRKRNLKIISRRIKNGKLEFIFKKTGSTTKTADEHNEMCSPCIDHRTVRKLAKLARKIEIKFGCPQDIEWSIRGKKKFFLQSRPITAVPQKKSWDERQVWTNANTGEVFPDAITPITWSIMELMFNPLFESTFRLFGANLGDNKLVGLVASRVYFNINTALGLAQYLPLKWNLSLHESFGGEHAEVFELGKVDIPDEDIPELGFSHTKMIMRLPCSICDIFSHTQKKSMKVIKELSSRSNKLRNLDVTAMTDQELARQFITAIGDTLESCDILSVLIGSLTFPILRGICAKWLNDDNGSVANRLLYGLDGMDDAQAGFELWNLALKARESTQVEAAVLSGGNWQVIRETIVGVEEGEAFLKNWDEFMIQHGHHCRGEMEVFNPRWSETPDYILSTLRTYLNSLTQTDPIQDYHDQIRKREQLTNRCRQKLRNPVKRLIFNHIVHRAQRGVVLRENWKNEVVRYAAAFRSILLELGQRLKNKDILENTGDIFFVKLEEIEPVTQGKSSFNVKETIATRRAEYEKHKSVMPPAVVIGEFNPNDYVPEAVNIHNKVLNGLSVSSGVVTGKARVILKADNEEQVLPGEILVAPFTDPGWTPYFMPAAAIVMDMGGMLSHGSIIAREYGIPSVVNVGLATKIIKTGQTIQVDADYGTVTILDKEEPS